MLSGLHRLITGSYCLYSTGQRRLNQLCKQVIYLPEDGVYCVSQETFPRFRRQEFGSEDGHELVEVDLAVT